MRQVYKILLWKGAHVKSLTTEKHYENLYIHFSHDEHFDPSFSEKHVHDFYEVTYILRGNGYYIVEGTKYEFRPGTLAIFRPGEYHCVSVEKKLGVRAVRFALCRSTRSQSSF